MLVFPDKLSINEHCTHNNKQFGGSLIKRKQILSIYRDFNKAFYFPEFSNGVIFSVDVGVQYLTFNIFYVRFPDELSIDEHCTHNNE